MRRTAVGNYLNFEGLESPQEMKEKLEASPFFRKSGAPKSTAITEGRVVFAFTKALARKDIVRKCSEIFPKYGRYTNHAVVNKGALEIHRKMERRCSLSTGRWSRMDHRRSKAIKKFQK